MIQTEAQNGTDISTILEWFKEQRTTTWGGHGWDVTDPKEAAHAARWFIQQMQEFQNFQNNA